MEMSKKNPVRPVGPEPVKGGPIKGGEPPKLKGKIPGGPIANPGQFKHGGKVKKTGVAKVHKGEVVLTAAQAKHAGKGKKTAKKHSRKRVSGKR